MVKDIYGCMYECKYSCDCVCDCEFVLAFNLPVTTPNEIIRKYTPFAKELRTSPKLVRVPPRITDIRILHLFTTMVHKGPAI